MSGEKVNGLATLKEMVEKDANESWEKHRKSSGSKEINGAPSRDKKENQSEVRTQIKLNIGDSKMFGNKLSIFGSKVTSENHSNIFANKNSVNLLSYKQKNAANTGSNMFSLAASSQPAVKTSQDYDAEEGSVHSNESGALALEQQMPEPTKKQMQYTYEKRTEKIGEFKLIRFKNGQSSTKEGIVLSLERDEAEVPLKPTYFILRNSATKISMYEALILPNTKLEHFMNREDNWKFWVVVLKKKEGKQEPEREVVKLQFESIEKASQFASILGFPAKKQE